LLNKEFEVFEINSASPFQGRAIRFDCLNKKYLLFLELQHCGFIMDNFMVLLWITHSLKDSIEI